MLQRAWVIAQTESTMSPSPVIRQGPKQIRLPDAMAKREAQAARWHHLHHCPARDGLTDRLVQELRGVREPERRHQSRGAAGEPESP